MRLSVDTVNQCGGFSGAPVKREIVWKKGGEEYTFDVYIRRLSYHTAVSDVRSLSTDGHIAARRLVHSIVDENGKPVFTFSDITGYDEEGNPVLVEDENGEMVERGGLDDALVTLLLVEVSNVNNMGKTQPPIPSS